MHPTYNFKEINKVCSTYFKAAQRVWRFSSSQLRQQ